MPSAVKSVGLRLTSLVVLVALWWLASWLMHDPDVLPTPLTIASTIVSDFTENGPDGMPAYLNIAITLARIFITFTAAMLAGIGIGLAMGLSRVLERSLLAIIPLMLTMPTILMVFLAVMWFGFSKPAGWLPS